MCDWLFSYWLGAECATESAMRAVVLLCYCCGHDTAVGDDAIDCATGNTKGYPVVLLAVLLLAVMILLAYWLRLRTCVKGYSTGYIYIRTKYIYIIVVV